MNKIRKGDEVVVITGRDKGRRGTVIRVLGEKVLVERRVRHPVIGKTITRSKKYHAHVDEGGIKQGDLVEIAECRPISRTKAWKVTRLIEKSKAV